MRAAAAALLVCLLLVSCRDRDDFYVRGLRRTEAGGAGSSVEDLEREIDRYREIVERKVEASGKLGTYYRMLALRYIDREMYGEAYAALREAVRIYPENPILFDLAGACAGRMARAVLAPAVLAPAVLAPAVLAPAAAGEAPGSGPRQREEWLKAAEAAYERAIELDAGYVEALYGLAVLRVYELGRPEEAEPLVDRILSKEQRNIDAMFLKGQVLYRTGRLEEAVDLYGKIADLTRVEERRRAALENRKRIEEELGGR